MKILIVDDELLVRIGIKSCIEWHKYGMEVAGEASDGEEALELTRKLKPDVILLDIKMPNMDGIELMSRLREERIECSVIILSGFDDIYHVKEAMKLGASDYLHKPCMSARDILDSLLNIKQRLEKEKASETMLGKQGELAKSKRMLKEAFLKDLLEGAACTPQQFKQNCSSYEIRLEDGLFSCLLFSVRNLSEILKRYAGSEITKLQSSIQSIMDSVFSKETGVEFLCIDKNSYLVLMGVKGVISERKAIEGVDANAKLICEALKQFLNIDVTVGVSDIHISFQEIKRAFNEANTAIRCKFYYGESSVIYYRNIRREYGKELFGRIDSMIERLKDNLTKNEYDNFNANLKEFIDFIEVEPCLSEEDIKKLFSAFLFLIKGGKDSFSEMEMLNKCETLRQLYKVWYEITASKLSGSQISKQYQACGHLVKGIMSYLEEHYSQEITLASLAEEFYVTPNYISRLFKEETGETLFNYLNGVRIEKAKNLLRDIQMKIYEIGFKVGFKSTVHFNIVFNKLTGLSPKQYRDNYL